MNEDRMEKEEIVASCKAAGQAIDIETCEICWQTCNVADPYGVEPGGYVCVGRVPFVRSAESDGWVCLYWLPEEKAAALWARIRREDAEPKDDRPDVKLTLDELDLIELLREWSADGDRLQLSASSEDGVWECELRVEQSDRVVVCRGVGNSFVEAFIRLDGNDVEPVEDDPF